METLTAGKILSILELGGKKRLCFVSLFIISLQPLYNNENRRVLLTLPGY